jgi:hypothetical protein
MPLLNVFGESRAAGEKSFAAHKSRAARFRAVWRFEMIKFIAALWTFIMLYGARSLLLLKPTLMHILCL